MGTPVRHTSGYSVKLQQLEPNLAHERGLWNSGYRHVAGIDEAGRGAWAGPVVAGAVILPPQDLEIEESLLGVRDSKLLSARRREQLLPAIKLRALCWGIGIVYPLEIDADGIVPATRKAMALALEALTAKADYLLIDHLSLPDITLPQKGLPKGDVHVLSIAAASILAKVSRDQIMVDLDASYPGYGFGQHKGYGTAKHRAALATLGPSPVHRMSFAPLQRGLP